MIGFVLRRMRTRTKSALVGLLQVRLICLSAPVTVKPLGESGAVKSVTFPTPPPPPPPPEDPPPPPDVPPPVVPPPAGGGGWRRKGNVLGIRVGTLVINRNERVIVGYAGNGGRIGPRSFGCLSD